MEFLSLYSYISWCGTFRKHVLFFFSLYLYDLSDSSESILFPKWMYPKRLKSVRIFSISASRDLSLCTTLALSSLLYFFLHLFLPGSFFAENFFRPFLKFLHFCLFVCLLFIFLYLLVFCLKNSFFTPNCNFILLCKIILRPYSPPKW